MARGKRRSEATGGVGWGGSAAREGVGGLEGSRTRPGALRAMLPYCVGVTGAEKVQRFTDASYRLVGCGVHGAYDALAHFLRHRLPQQVVDGVHLRAVGVTMMVHVRIAKRAAMNGRAVSTSWGCTVWRWSSGHTTHDGLG